MIQASVNPGWMKEYLLIRTVADGRVVGVAPMLSTVGLFVGLNEYGYAYRYCYPTLQEAVIAFARWDGIGHPLGPWIKRKGLGDDLHNPQPEAEYDYE
jgi:hypothetical protein